MVKYGFDPEDIAQQAWLEAWRARKGFNGDGLWTWLATILKRTWWKAMRDAERGKRGAGEVNLSLEAAEHVEVSGGQEEAVDSAKLHDALATLPVAPRAALEANLMGYDGRQYADERGVSIQAAGDALRRGVAALRKKWGVV